MRANFTPEVQRRAREARARAGICAERAEALYLHGKTLVERSRALVALSEQRITASRQGILAQRKVHEIGQESLIKSGQ